MDERVLVIGRGQVGQRLGDALAAAGWDVRYVTRTSGWEAALDADDAAPRLLCMREDDLPEAYARFPTSLRDRLVLVQNGFLEVVLGEQPLVSRGLIWFTAKGDFFEQLRDSSFYGTHAEPLAGALTRGGIPSGVHPTRDEFVAEMIVKGAWNCIVGLPPGLHELTLGEYLERERAECEALVGEATAAAGAFYGVPVAAEAALDTLLTTTRPLGRVRGGAKALAWRNGAVAIMGRRCGVPTPTHDRLLAAAGWNPDGRAHQDPP
jgi:ketopantoate reductase